MPALSPDDTTSGSGTPERREGSAGAGRGLTMFELARLEEARRQAAEVERRVRDSGSVRGRATRPTSWLSALAFVGALGAVLTFFRPTDPDVAIASAADLAAFRREAAGGAEVALGEGSGRGASARPGFGKSGDVLVRVAMPGQLVEAPVALPAGTRYVRYTWVRAADSSEVEAPRNLVPGAAVPAPARPGVYHLAVGEGADRRVVGDLSLAVLVPFQQKLAGTVNGYRVGSWPFERLGGERPLGFVEVTPRTAHLPLSRHIRLADFVTHDGQRQWPRYVVVSPRLLDKVELVLDEVARLRGVPDGRRFRVSVNSGFRTPLHNSGVEGSALNSRHQYGDAADVAIDADGDGRFTTFDSRIVALAVETIERRHPELTGGLGVYVNGRSPFVHIDARGRRARWWR